MNTIANLRLVILATIAMFLISTSGSYAQEKDASDGEKVEEKKKDKPIRPAWNAAHLIETQTDLVYAPKTLEWIMQHRFDMMNASTKFDFAGIYGPSNIRMGLNYGLFKNAQIGAGATKIGGIITTDVNWKYKILTQTRSNSMPISLAYYGNAEITLGPEDQFGSEYKFVHRMAYFQQLIISRKINKNLSLQATLNYSHYNQVDSAAYPNMKHDNFGFGIAGRYKIGGNLSAIFEYDQALTTPGSDKWVKENPANSKTIDEVGLRNLSLGLEISTSSHAFHVFVTTYKGISYQRNMVYNTNFFTDGAVLIGFNITRNWNF